MIVGVFLVQKWLKKDLGFKENESDEIVEKEWKRRVKHVCKPCWELKYCPYGPLVEQFPLYCSRKEKGEYIKNLKKELQTGEFEQRVITLHKLSENDDLKKKRGLIEKALASNLIEDEIKAKIRTMINELDQSYLEIMRQWAIEQIKNYNPNDYPEETDYREKCVIFGHYCPVFFVNEPFTETSEMRRIDRSIPRTMFLRIVRRDNQTCQICGKNLREDEIEIDHIIPVHMGGPTEEHNLRVACIECNRKRKTLEI